MAHSSHHQNSQQSASKIFPWPPSSLSPNQLDFSSQLQVQQLHQDLAHAQKQIQEYQHLIASLYTTLQNIENTKDLRLATSSTAGAVIASPSPKPKFSVSRPPNFPRSPTPSNHDRVFRGHRTVPSRPTDSVADITKGSGVSQLSNAKACQPNRSVSVASESIQPPLSVAQQPISPPETSTFPKDIPNQRDRWSVDFNSGVKPALNVKLEHVLTPGGRARRVRFSPDGRYLAVGVDSGGTYIYDVKTGAESCFLADHFETRKRGIWSLCFSPDGKYLAGGDSDGQLRIWDFSKKRIRNIFREHTNMIRDLDFSPDGRFLVSCSYDRTVRIWRMRDGFSKLLEDKTASYFYSVKFNPDGRYISAGNGDGVVRIWNVRTSQLVEKWTAHGRVVLSTAFKLNGKGLVSSSTDDTWKYWDVSLLELAEPRYGMTKDSTARQKSKPTAHTNDVGPISISPDGRWVVSASGDHTVHIWNLRAALQCTLRGHKDRVWSVDFCPTGNYLASGSGDGRVALWRYEAA